jgi:guanylate kinase
MARIREEVAKKLWYRAGGRCAFPHKLELSFPGTGHLFGRMAHIVGRSSHGPRGDPLYDAGVDDYENLILLCPEHHDVVDKDVSGWAVPRLRELKSQHEEWVRQRLKWGESPSGVRSPTKILTILWGASSVGKDVVLNRVLLKLEQKFPAVSLQRYTTRPRRPEEAEYTPFRHLARQRFFERVSRGEISCVHTSNETFYGFDSQFEGDMPAGTVVLTCMRQFNYLQELGARGAATGLAVQNVLLTADYDSVHNRTLQRGTRESEKRERLRSLKNEVEWFNQNATCGIFDLVIDNSDNSSLNAAVNEV